MLVEDHGSGDGKPLARAFADLLRGKEGIKDVLANVGRNVSPCVPDSDDDRVTLQPRLYGDATFWSCPSLRLQWRAPR